jgi:lipopolysaccharide assembly outer membrane protein LptD (OstA)
LLPAVLLFVSSAMASMPDEAQLSADRMRFDAQSGDFLATGNVTIQADGLTVYAPRGAGNVKDKEIRFAEGIVASGDWQGQWIDLAAGSIALFFAQTPTYIAEGTVKGDIGKISVDVDKFYMKGTAISALNVRRLEDREEDIAFGADSVRGTLLEGVLTSFTAERNVWLRGRPNSAGDAVDIRADTAVYSVERGSVVLSGNVRAVQRGRVLTSQSLVYFPGDNRVDAIGGVDLTGSGGANPARITIDLNREKQRRQGGER